MTGRSAAARTDGAAKDAEPTTCSTEMLKGRYILSGSGTELGDDFDSIVNFVLDGKGAITESDATLALRRPPVVTHVALSDGTYSVDDNCAGKLKFSAVPDIFPPNKHGHETQIMVFDGGRQFTMLNLRTTLPGIPNNMAESFMFTAHRV